MKREEEIIELRTKLIKLIRKISKTIGFYWWRRYISCSFWKNIEIPINLSLTIFSTIISAQASTNNFIKQEHYVVLSFASVLLTTFNTYFRPLQKYNTNTNDLKKWYELGAKLDQIFYKDRIKKEELELRIKECNSLLIDINSQITTSVLENQNFLSDLIHLVIRGICIKKKEPWLSFAEDEDLLYENDRYIDNRNYFSKFVDIFKYEPKIIDEDDLMRSSRKTFRNIDNSREEKFDGPEPEKEVELTDVNVKIN